MAIAPRTESQERIARAECERMLARFAEMVRMGRKLQHVSQADFADALGVSRRTVQHMEQGDGQVAMATWLSALQSLGLLRRIREAVRPSDEMIAASVRDVADRAARRRRDDPLVDTPAEFPRPAPRPE